jgi:pyruvate/2-oxoglutarate dehydrogenase complex dihydrolipoamide dehydrogenase (E3) component
MTHYDAIIIGAGQAGAPLAKRLASAGWKTAIIEKDYVGGTCINYGCTPTKTMVASARIAYLAAKSKEYGIHIPEYSVDMHAVIDRKNGVVTSFRAGSESRLKQTEHLDLFYGEASFTGPCGISVALNGGGDIDLDADHIFINSGGRTAIPSIPGIDGVNYLTSTSIMAITEVPRHLVIIGGSYIGLEFGQMFRRFGSEVSIIEAGGRFLPREDEDIADELKKILQEDGIGLRVGVRITGVEQEGDDIVVSGIYQNEAIQLRGSHLLVAAGRPIPMHCSLKRLASKPTSGVTSSLTISLKQMYQVFTRLAT